MNRGYDAFKTGCVIEKHRERMGLTLEAASDRLGISVSHLYQLEHGHRGASVHLLMKISEVFDVELKQLLGIEEKEYDDVSIDELLSGLSIDEQTEYKKLFVQLLKTHRVRV